MIVTIKISWIDLTFVYVCVYMQISLFMGQRSRVYCNYTCTTHGSGVIMLIVLYVQMCDESVVRLQGELEVLRARKAVLLCVAKQDHPNVSSVLSHHTLTFDSCSGVARLRHKLKLQRKRSNFLRVKLGQ